MQPVLLGHHPLCWGHIHEREACGCKPLNGIEEEEGLSRSPDTGKPNNLTRTDREDQLPCSAGWKASIHELAEYILEVVTYHRYNLSNIIPPCKDNHA